MLQILGQGSSTLPVSDRVAIALQNVPDGIISIRLVSESGVTIDGEIGEGTVEAWRAVYATEAIANRR